jgi:hypothetical protein
MVCFLLDTNVIIDVLRRRKRRDRLIEELLEQGFSAVDFSFRKPA